MVRPLRRNKPKPRRKSDTNVAVRLRLMRMGKRKQPTYRVVAADKRKARNGRFIEIIGFYDPRRDPSVIEIENEKAVRWLSEGAQPSERVEKLLKISGAWDEFKGLPTGTSVTAPPVTPPEPTLPVSAMEEAEVPAESSVADEPVEAAVDDAVADEPVEAAVDDAVADEPVEAAVDDAVADDEEAP
jgi:small subunit ribosomal protein S16